MDNAGFSEYAGPERKKRPYLLQLVLFLITLATTLLAGALQQGVDVLENPEQIWRGIPFSFTLILILGSHELGHYLMSRKRRIEVSLPYFIPAPSFLGTFGAFIRMRSPILDRNTLFDIGVAGPLAGLVTAVPIVMAGLVLSDIVPVTGEEGIVLGNSLLFSFFNWLVHGSLPDTMDVALHPIAFSGWIGLFVTNLNLLPVGQLDGGHVIYALFGRKQKVIGWIMIVLLVILGVIGWIGWLVWAVLLLVLGMRHPPVLYDWMPLDKRRRAIGWGMMGLFLLTFIPSPF